MVKIVFSNHALIKISQRKLLKPLVVETIKNPDFIKPSYNFREERYKKIKKNYLKVVLVKEGVLLVVVTVHWVAKFKIK